MVLTAEYFGHQHQNIYYLPDNSLKLVIEILFLRSINGAVVKKKKTAPNNCKDFCEKIARSF